MAINLTHTERRSVIIFILILSWLVSFNLPLYATIPAGKFQVRGIATDAESGSTVPYATITVQNSKGIVKRLAADVNGKFEFALDSTGKFSVLVQSIGYQTLKIEVIIDDKTTKIDLGPTKLKPGTENIGEIAVVAQKPLIRTEIDKIVYNLEADPESKTATALEMFLKLPRVTVDGEENIQLKGSSNFKIKTFCNRYYFFLQQQAGVVAFGSGGEAKNYFF